MCGQKHARKVKEWWIGLSPFVSFLQRMTRLGRTRKKTKWSSLWLVVDNTVSERNKTNLLEVKFTKINLMTGNADEYCNLRKRLQNKKWVREDPDEQTFWKMARDFSDCVSQKSKYTFNAALMQLMARAQAIYAKNYPGMRRYMKMKAKPDDLLKKTR